MNALAPEPRAIAAQRWSVPSARLGLGVLAALCVAGLLLAFQRVVSEGVQRSVTRHRLAAAMSEASWRCEALGPLQQRAACREQLKALP